MSDKQRFTVKVNKDTKAFLKRAITLKLAKDLSLDPDNEETAGAALDAIVKEWFKAQAVA